MGELALLNAPVERKRDWREAPTALSPLAVLVGLLPLMLVVGEYGPVPTAEVAETARRKGAK